MDIEGGIFVGELKCRSFGDGIDGDEIGGRIDCSCRPSSLLLKSKFDIMSKLKVQFVQMKA